MITKEHAGPLVYGGIVTLAKWYDNKRIAAGNLTEKDVLKMYSFWTYLGIGVVAVVATIWYKKYTAWTDKLTSGFIFGLPGFIYDTMKNTGVVTNRNAGSAAVAEAQKILAMKRAAALGAGRQTDRTYQPEFKTAQIF